ncbi:uncharacterized protein RJT21DRAFT_119116 [Scheffersomyces amazonensis]|uniref:uncharacterized protein n=1 Tax=Scheffersomyces amazonensis TaxID=1078765 RepID=UPI00315CD038
MKLLYNILLLYVFLPSLVWATDLNPNWNTLYSFTDGKIYLHLKNNDLVSLNFSISGFDKQSPSDINLLNNQPIDTLASPPLNSTLFIFNEQLYGLTSNISSIGSNIDKCGNGLIKFIKFDNGQWIDVIENIEFNGVNDGSFYEYPTILNSPLENSTIYIYGGICSENDQVSSRLISFDFDQETVSNITTSTKPQPFYGATNLIAPNPQTQLVIGGQNSQGWLNMYQLATWNFNSGWSFQQISNDGSGTLVNSRKFALALPIFNQLNNDSANTFENDFQVNEILLVGGQLLESDSTPIFAKLITSSNDWVWNTTINVTLNYDEILGAATIFNTLVVINSTTTSTTSSGKRDDSDQYTISLYDASSFAPINNLKTNVNSGTSSSGTSSKSSSSTSGKTTKIVIGILVPIIALLIAACVTFYILRKRKQQQDEDDMNTLNYSIPAPFFGSGTDHESMLMNEKARRKSSIDSNSTLDAASFDSWMKKREEFDRQHLSQGQYPNNHQQHYQNVRNSYLASNETLNPDINGSNDEIHVQPNNPVPIIYNNNTLNQPHTNSLTKSTVSKLRKSLSFSNYNNNSSSTTLEKAPSMPVLISRNNTGSGEYMRLKKKRSNPKLMSLRLTSSEQLIPSYEITDEMDEVDLSEVPEEEEYYKQQKQQYIQDSRSITSHESDASAYNKMDVQVLVSSKRRSILRVANPDVMSHNEYSIPEGIEYEGQNEEEEDIATDIQSQLTNPFTDSNVEMRQRVPSGGSQSDNEDQDNSRNN